MSLVSNVNTDNIIQVILVYCVRTDSGGLGQHKSQAYTSKRRILIQVFPPPNEYTKSANACIHYVCIIMYPQLNNQGCTMVAKAEHM